MYPVSSIRTFGHSKISTTLDIYSDALPELDESAADLLEAASTSDAVGSAEA